jgi:hypothetical protein
MTATTTRRLAAAGVTALAVAIGMTAALAKPVTFTLPPESSTLKQTGDPGHAKAEAWCSTCHSRDYITTQPRGKGKDFWTASVTKMVTVYGAPIPEADRPLIVDYLAANY